MNHVDLFSGIGGFALAAKWVWGEEHNIVSFVEIDKFCQKVLAKHWPDVPIIEDIKDCTYETVMAHANRAGCRTSRNGNDKNRQEENKERTKQSQHKPCRCNQNKSTPTTIDLLTGGFPCQPFSVAGKQRGSEDDRAIWPQMFRVIKEVRPRYVIAENVTGIIRMELDNCLSDLEAEEYTCETFVLPACAVEAPHRRDRVWIVGYRQQPGLERHTGNVKGWDKSRREQENKNGPTGETGLYQDVAGTENANWRGTDGTENTGRRHTEVRGQSEPSGGIQHWLPEPELGGTPYGFPMWLYRHIGRGLSYGESTRRTEILRKLWSKNVAEKIWKTVGGFDRIQKAEILFAIVCQYENDPDKARLFLESQKALEGFVRSLWIRQKITGSSYRSKDREQLREKHSNSMQTLSRLLAFNRETNWQISDWEDGVTRVSNNSINRVDRLKSLGNAIVPQVVMPIMQAIKEIDSEAT